MTERTLTAAICTRNRANRLNMAIDSMAAQKDIGPHRFDVLIVDNGSTDDTLEVAERARDRLPFGLTIAQEMRQGISFARNKALEHAKGEIIAFLDDDAVAAPDWALAHTAAYDSDPQIGGVMGRILPIWEAERPAWLDSWLESYLTIADYGTEPMDLNGTTHAPVGANMSFPKQALVEVGGFNVRFGFGGLDSIPGEENEVALRLQSRGWKIVYWPQACVQHGVSADRMTLKWFKKRVFDQGRYELLYDAKHFGPGKALGRVVTGALIRGPLLSVGAALDFATGNHARAARRASVPWAILGYVKEFLATGGATSKRVRT